MIYFPLLFDHIYSLFCSAIWWPETNKTVKQINIKDMDSKQHKTWVTPID